MNKPLSAASIAFFLVASFSAVAEEVSRPIWVEGDTWTYRHVDRMSGNRETTRKYRVTKQVPKGYEIDYARSTGSDSTTRLYTRDINELLEDATKSLVERRTYDWPLTPGRQWKFQYTEASVNYPGRTYIVRMEARVEGRESVVVPAGEFDTVRVRVEGDYVRSNDQRSAPLAYTVWYSPKVKRAVKTHFTRGQFTSMTNWTDSVTELTAYRVAD